MVCAVAPGLFAGMTACENPLPDAPARPTGDAGVEVTARLALEPAAELDAAPAVLRLRVTLPSGGTEAPEALGLFEGELGSYHLTRIAKDDLPETLLARRVPSLSWADAASLVLAPSVPLSPGVLYSLASRRLGLIAVFHVAPEPPASFLSRVWPPADGGRGFASALYCSDSGAPEHVLEVELDPAGVPAVLAPGTDDSGFMRATCVNLRPLGEVPLDEPMVLPPAILDHAVDPEPLVRLIYEPPGTRACSSDEPAFGPSCARVLDDRLLVSALSEPTFWIVRGPGLPVMEAVEAGRSFTVRGLSPASHVTLDVTAIDLAGNNRRSSVEVDTRPAAPHVVINEVLADSIGPEPDQEWIELVNDGTTSIELAGFVLEDVGGRTELPEYELLPGQAVLLVTAAFSADSAWDTPPAPGSAFVRVPELGKNGLANSGEPLSLRSADGSLLSRFPALPRPKPGVSVARQNPWSLDGDPGAFALHAAPGASPGAPNVVQ
jgi:hypothetical protein